MTPNNINHAELYRRVRNGSLKPLLELDEFDTMRFMGYLICRIKRLENELQDAAKNACDCRSDDFMQN